VRTAKAKITSFDPPDSQLTQPSGINDTGAITGWFQDSGGNRHGFIRTL
jgi:hypothetical protein